MGFVERHRSEIIVLVVLPISLVIWCVRTLQRWWRRPRPEQHGARVARVAAAVRAKAATGPLRTDRSVYDSHSVRNADKASAMQVPMRDLYAILGLSEDGRTLHVEPGATVGEVTAWLLSRELQLECTLEMADATLGGLAMATGMTTHSHVCSLIHETIVEYEIVTASGDIILAREDNEHADLWRALPWSHGTLGLLTSLRLRVVPASPWVQLTYTPYASALDLGVAYRAILAQAERDDPETPFFVEAIVFDRERSVLMTGKLGENMQLQALCQTHAIAIASFVSGLTSAVAWMQRTAATTDCSNS